jgi:hypothetical protein
MERRIMKEDGEFIKISSGPIIATQFTDAFAELTIGGCIYINPEPPKKTRYRDSRYTTRKFKRTYPQP